MANYRYIIVGGGMTAAAAVEGIREVDRDGTIGMISIEKYRPYNRPPLTKKLWQGKAEDSIWRDLPQDQLELVTGCRVRSIDLEKQQVQDEDGKIYEYEKLLLATGGKPRRLESDAGQVLYYRTLNDYRTVRSWTGKGARIGVIGGGFIGSELAAALTANGEQAVMVISGKGISARLFPEDLSKYVTDYYREKGVEIHAGLKVQEVEPRGDQLVMRGEPGQEVVVNHIIAGIGIQPNTGLAEQAGIRVASEEEGGGIWVDEHLQTSQPGVFAAGDAASFFNPGLQRRMRVEHEDNANTMGRTAGLNMAGQATAYQHQPFFYSDLFDLGYEAVGEIDPALETFSDWQEPFRKGVVYYLKDGRVRGVLLWNVWDQVDAARKLIASGGTFETTALKGRLPEK